MKIRLPKYSFLAFIVLFVAVFAYFTAPIFKPRIDSNVVTDPFWVTSLDEHNRLHVFNLTLEKSTLKEALVVFGNRLNLSIFEENGELQLEAYFRETRVGKIFTGRIALSLESSQEELKKAVIHLKTNKRSTQAKTIYEVPVEQIPNFYDHQIFSVAFIPIVIRLTENDIHNKFGKPEETIVENETITHYLYSTKGINIAIDQTHKKSSFIQYINPAHFGEKVLIPIQKQP